ncbi:kynureninase [Pontibacter qinzhouensis]|uniref:Kynureninase n=1 Tax=Pontibacter qinzhouensis TaxID=2603253 RepID=A0A5C8KFN1_9BACT|nr:kynureninase [Pontibacter qinzhouensis]TXK52842.1 kynureninase [Pontibacter qinzhouensis]
MNYSNTLAFAQEQDQKDPLRHLKDRFYAPQLNKQDAIYFCGNSLGLQPKSAQAYLDHEMQNWADFAVEGHFKTDTPWLHYHELLTEATARVVGARPLEVVVMNQLTVNLHLMLVSFYRPQGKRFKIITEGGAFPSDQYALESQARFHGYNPDEAVVELFPREGEHTLRTEDILASIEAHKEELALVMMGGINYYTGQVFDMEAITKAGQAAGAFVGFDLAHAAGNVLLHLHDWNVDFAVWCTYKYMNSGPGGTSGVFVHERHAHNAALPRFAGWWGHEVKERFQMKKGFIPMPGAAGWQLSNAQILPMAVHRAALELFDEAGMEQLRAKSEQLTGFLEFLIDEIGADKSQLEVITPRDPQARGCQLSLLVKQNARQLFDLLMEAGIIVDYREPNVIRVAPTPLYNSFEEVYRFAEVLRVCLTGKL